MTLNAANRRLAARLIRNIVVAVAVTAIFGFKAAETGRDPAPAPIALAAK